MIFAYRTEYNYTLGIEYVIAVRAWPSLAAFEEYRDKWRAETWHLITVEGSDEKP